MPRFRRVQMKARKLTVKDLVLNAVDGKTLAVKEIAKIIKKPIGQVYTVISLL